MPDEPLALLTEGDGDFLQHINQAFDEAMQSFQFQDKAKTELAYSKAKTAFKKLSNELDDNERLFAQTEINCIRLFLELLRLIFFQAEQKLEKAYEKYKECVKICQEGFNVSGQLNTDGIKNKEAIKLLFTYIFKLYEIFLEGIGMHMQMAIDRKKGKIVSEAAVLRTSALHFKLVEELDFVDHPIIIALRQMIHRTAEVYENNAEHIEQEQAKIQFFSPIARKIFIIHGHDEGSLRILEKMLEETFKLEVIVLKDEAGLGDSVIEKFEDKARFSGYAIALLSPDDIVKNKTTKYFQARPNVLYELGWFSGRFGRSRVCIIKQKQVQLPSDLGGIITLDYYESILEVQAKLGTELNAAGMLI